ncbi:MAG: hypothetical protein L0271_08890, partial [Gemmatimonadetes bacterium]|nr:hypothetical protein [Gemmatimonadota bacterium]
MLAPLTLPALPRTLVAALLCIAAGCGLSDEENETLEMWLACVECTAGELTDVVAIGGRAIRPLRSALEQGLRAGTRAELAQQLALRWRELNDPTLDSATYV